MPLLRKRIWMSKVSKVIPLEWNGLPNRGNWSISLKLDRGAWFDLKTANEKLNQAQTMLIKELAQIVSK